MVKLLTIALAGLLGLILLITAAASGTVSALFGDSSRPSQNALADIPARYLRLYRAAAAHVATDRGCQLDWTVLAAIGKIETHHGRSELPGVHSGANSAGAQGPMQFLPATFAHYDQPVPPGGSNPPSPYDPINATYAAARYLCDSGAREGRLRAAIYAYNHAGWYVDQVLAQAAEYRTASGRWVVPVRGTCTSGYGPRRDGFHHGQDIAAPHGTPIRAAAAGRVIDAGPATGYGLWIRIQHPDGTITTYGHNHRNHVHTGQTVQAGQVIATVGNRGQSSGPHLHFQIDVNGQPADPVNFYHRFGGQLLCR